MILNPGDKVLVVHRRLFEADTARYFLGLVDAYEAGIAKVVGTSWVKDAYSGVVIHKDEPRIKIIPINSSGFLIYQLPDDVDLDTIEFRVDDTEQTLHLTAAGKTLMDLTERPRP
jgi:hypothetical protein